MRRWLERAGLNSSNRVHVACVARGLIELRSFNALEKVALDTADVACHIVNHMVKYSPRLLDRTFGALADCTRRRILHQLTSGSRCVTELAKPYSMSLPAVSKHIRVLERASLIKRQRSGRVHTLMLRPEPMKQAQAWLEEYRGFWEESFNRLDDYLAEMDSKENRQQTKQEK